MIIILPFKSFMHRNRIASFYISLGKLMIISWGDSDFEICIFTHFQRKIIQIRQELRWIPFFDRPAHIGSIRQELAATNKISPCHLSKSHLVDDSSCLVLIQPVESRHRGTEYRGFNYLSPSSAVNRVLLRWVFFCFLVKFTVRSMCFHIHILLEIYNILERANNLQKHETYYFLSFNQYFIFNYEVT